jgi:apolipoprotein N-acyltransferase
MMRIPLGEYQNPGVVQAAMAVKDQWVMPNICYEDLFGEEIAQQLRAQADTKQGAANILLNVSNLAWYGDSIAIPQHLQISQMRSLETGRPMLRSTNTGATAIIDARGQVVARLDTLTRGTLAGQVQGMRGLTPYIRFGNWLWAGFAVVAMLGAYLLSQRQNSKSQT